MRLGETICHIEKDIGQFSVHYKTIDKEHTYDIPFHHKPAEQLIEALGGTINPNAILSTSSSTMKTSENNNDVTINGFTKNTSGKKLTIKGSRLDRLLSSGKVYINNDLFPKGLFQKTLKEKLINHDGLPAETKGIHWENLAVGVCIAQEIDLLIGTLKSKHDRAHTTYREGIIEQDEPALLLLSSPRLNLTKKLDSHLDEATQARFIEGMFRNLFDATLKEGRQYIAMPAAGLGKHSSKPEMYFSSLMKVAKEFPKLNIIYHPGEHEGIFDRELKKFNLHNVTRATKNIIFIADLLTKRGNLCALHIPADSDVVYGLSDIGGHWKSITSLPFQFGDNPFAKRKNETSQTYIGGFSTAPLNSYGFNPKTYATVIERNLAPQQDVSSSHSVKGKDKDDKSSIHQIRSGNKTDKHTFSSKQDQSAVLPVSTEVKPAEKPDEDVKKIEHPVIDVLPNPDTKNKIIEPSTIGSPITSGIFSKPDQPTSKKLEKLTSLNNKQLKEINQAIDRLTGEIQSCWPYPNKDVKQIKINALEALKTNARTMSVQDAIAAVKKEYLRALEGSLSTRTKDLFDKLERSETTTTLKIS